MAILKEGIYMRSLVVTFQLRLPIMREKCLISRIRLGHTKLHSSLHVIGKHPSVICDVCNPVETVDHVLLLSQNMQMKTWTSSQTVLDNKVIAHAIAQQLVAMLPHLLLKEEGGHAIL